MSEFIAPADVTILDLLRRCNSMTVAELSDALEVTATAVRQRLNRLLSAELIQRTSSANGRGRPTHHYRITERGRRQSGANFADLAIALWEEIRSIRDLEVRRGLLQRLAVRLASQYGAHIRGATLQEKMESLAELFGDRNIPLAVGFEGELPVLQAEVCPYPGLAEQDRSVCAMEKAMFSELLGEELKLSECRLDGGNCCTFTPRDMPREINA
jgi:DeoR family transcriptional regulator, suf operon transcriptional repressor